MLKKICLLGLIALMVIGGSSFSLGGQENPIVELGKINVPKDLEWGLKILPKGEYRIALFRGRRSGIALATAKPDEAGMTASWSVDAEVTEIKQNYPQPKVDVGVVTEAGGSFVQICVFIENKLYKSLWKCAAEAINLSQREKEQGQVDPAVKRELRLLKEVHALLDRFAEKIWPGWDGYKTLDFTLHFPNRDVVVVTQNERLPQRFKILPGETMNGKAVYIDRTKELSGRIGATMSIQGHGDISGVTSILMSLLETEAAKPESKLAPEEKSPKSQEEDMRLTRMLIYVHEAYHSLQARLMMEADKAGLTKRRGEMNPDFDANLEYSVYADIEGKTLLRAYQEKDQVKALEYFKDSWVAREIKHKAMPPGAAAADERTTRAEGTATYANLEMAILVKETGYQREVPKDNQAISGGFEYIDDYIKKEGISRLADMAGETLEVSQRPYLYGAFQCFLLDRFFPRWKKELFEKDRTLDEVIAEFLQLSAEDQSRITGRLKTDVAFDEIWAKHSRVIKDRDDTVQLIMNRKGKKYLIDLKQAQRGFEINPRNLEHVVLYKGDELFPHGLVKLIYGSLILESQDTPMRLSFSPHALEWVDTEAKAGEKGYELKYGEKVEDLYRNITLTTRGFTMTAKAIKIVGEADTVIISIID
jgi:hypothetical protein